MISSVPFCDRLNVSLSSGIKHANWEVTDNGNPPPFFLFLVTYRRSNSSKLLILFFLHVLSLSAGSPAVESSFRIIDTEYDIDIRMKRLRVNSNVSHFVMWQSQDIVTHVFGEINVKDTLDLFSTLIRLASLDDYLNGISNPHLKLIDFAR